MFFAFLSLRQSHLSRRPKATSFRFAKHSFTLASVGRQRSRCYNDASVVVTSSSQAPFVGRHPTISKASCTRRLLQQHRKMFSLTLFTNDFSNVIDRRFYWHRSTTFTLVSLQHRLHQPSLSLWYYRVSVWKPLVVCAACIIIS